jgi:hypothetical protein
MDRSEEYKETASGFLCVLSRREAARREQTKRDNIISKKLLSHRKVLLDKTFRV